MKVEYEKGQQFLVKEAFGTLCCHLIFQPDEILTFLEQPTPNRLLVLYNNIHVHKVKRSTFNRCTEVIQEGEVA